MKKIWKRVCTGILALTTILTALPITSVQAAETQYWTESSERVGYIEHVMNDGTIHSTWIAILVLSAAGITGVRIWNKKKQVKRLGIEEKKEEEE